MITRGQGEGEMGSCSLMSINFQLYKTNKFWKSAEQHHIYSYQHGMYTKIFVKRVDLMLNVLTIIEKKVIRKHLIALILTIFCSFNL